MADAEPDHQREGRSRGPPAARRAGQRDGDREHGRQPDEDVERAARPIGEQHEGRRHGPGDDEADGDEPEFEPADPQRASLPGAFGCRAAARDRKYRPGWDRRVIV